MTLGYDDAASYEGAGTYFGAVAGRCANRIARGAFTCVETQRKPSRVVSLSRLHALTRSGARRLDGTAHALACNNGPNALHGGPSGFHRRWWRVDALLGADGAPLPADASASPAGVRLAYTSPDGEEGYPGELTATVTYLLAAHEALPALHTRFSARAAGRATLVNLAQHAYWNLGGHASGTVLAHELQLHASRYTPVDADLIPTGELAPVDNTPFDFRAAKPIGRDAAGVPGGRGFDHNFALDGPNGAMRCAVAAAFRWRAYRRRVSSWLLLRRADACAYTACGPAAALRAAAAPPGALTLAAEASHAPSGRLMRLWTDAPGVQLYIGGFLDGEPGKGGAVYPQHAGFCLETQIFPDAVNQKGFPSPVLRPGEEYVHTMVTQFTTR